MELYTIAGWAMTALGWITTDIGHPDIATRHLRTAWAFAENTADNELRGWIRAAQNTAAAWRGEHQEAVEAATDGLSHAGSGTVMLLHASAKAIDLAHLGRVCESETALQEAVDIYSRTARR
ncbi:hypothetical protein ACFYO1_02945 [Nocardia sp. NPDC006044]|uniref:hypothetical protein n=1 Tax=Nocardia sp. NPDC006044 TaxID=3364306 RepID=UPI0036CC569E